MAQYVYEHHSHQDGQPGSRVVSHRVLIGDDWAPDESIKITATNNYGNQEAN